MGHLKYKRRVPTRAVHGRGAIIIFGVVHTIDTLRVYHKSCAFVLAKKDICWQALHIITSELNQFGASRSFKSLPRNDRILVEKLPEEGKYIQRVSSAGMEKTFKLQHCADCAKARKFVVCQFAENEPENIWNA
jgi:hypothetical protein